MEQTVKRRDPIVLGSLWMIGVSLVLFFLPAVNGLIGGVVGGYKVGNVKRALGAAILPAIVVCVGLWLLLAVFNLPVVGFLSGVALGLWVLFSSIGVLVGAAVGGAMAGASSHRRLPA
ncbi:hypothetical protein JQX13_25875 [Archangium violaceum]|uniref:hypothetical protein n=1 Tax=Archangium violaceum TaxID=83451 RepID=UPI00193B61C0|nr:hypothetical protein [Archangium violaceum]QRK13153.1 hypothetical protein JQX13_25875 [Archangium violaceum]